MNIHELKNDLISKVLDVDDKDFLLSLQDRVLKHLYPRQEYQTTLYQILSYQTKDTGPTYVRLGEKEKEVKTWKELYTTVIVWVLDMHNVTRLNKPISDHYQRAKYAVNTEPVHLDGKHFHSEVKHGELYIEGHGNTDHHLKTLQYIFKQFQLNWKELEIRFLGPINSSNTLHGTI